MPIKVADVHLCHTHRLVRLVVAKISPKFLTLNWLNALDGHCSFVPHSATSKYNFNFVKLHSQVSKPNGQNVYFHTGLPPFKSVMVTSAPAANNARKASTSPHTEIFKIKIYQTTGSDFPVWQSVPIRF